MTSYRREARSEYLYWAKTRSQSRFNLATSGVRDYPLEKLAVQISDLALSGPSAYGYEPLQERLARKAGVPKECVAATTGTSMGNHLAMAALLEAGDEILIEQPAYEPLLAAARYLGAQVQRFPRRIEDGFQIDPREVERAITPRTRLVVLTNLHNLSGVRVPEGTLRLIGEIARSLGARVLVDEVYLEALFDPQARSAFHLGDHFVVSSSLTKAYGLPGLRCGWVLAAAPIAERVWRLNDLFGVIPAHAAERLSVIALDRLSEIASEAKALIACNRALLEHFLDSRQDLLAIRPPAGTILFPQLVQGHGDAFCQLLRQKYETSVAPGRFFEMPNHFRLGIGGDTETLKQGLERIGTALDELKAMARAGG